MLFCLNAGANCIVTHSITFKKHFCNTNNIGRLVTMLVIFFCFLFLKNREPDTSWNEVQSEKQLSCNVTMFFYFL